ncbi:MAG: porin family protein [Flavobacteriales bacterium]|nr:porin family protein [Flavobacteriales bacterium]
MKKIYSILVVAIMLLSFQSMAQVAAGINLGINKSTQDNSEALFGGELNFKYSFSDNVRAGANLGFYQKSDKASGITVSSNVLPFSVFGEYLFLEDDFKPYAGIHLGALQTTSKLGNFSASETYFSLTPTVGADYMVSDQLGINFNIKYGVAFYKNIVDETESFSTISPNLGVFFMF